MFESKNVLIGASGRSLKWGVEWGVETAIVTDISTKL